MKCVWLILTLCAAANCQAPAQAPAQSAAAQPAPKGSLSGQVVNGKTGAPLKKASVRLSFINQGNGPGRGAPGPQSAQQQVDVAQIQMQVNAALAQAGLPVSPVNMSGMPQGPSIRTVETDESGRFVFTGLAGGKYRLSAERQGFLRQSYGERKYSGGGTPVVVGDGQNVTNLLFRMNPQGVITGKVLDEDGEPMANVQVRAHRYMYVGGKRQWVQIASNTSSDIGEYRLPDLQPGRYLVSTNARNIGRVNMSPNEPLSPNPDMTYAVTYYPNTQQSGTAIPIDVGAGSEIRGIDIRPIKARVWRVRGQVSGVEAGAGRGRTAMQISLASAEGPSDNRLNTGARPPDGQFEIRNVPSGSYILHAQAQAGGQMFAASMPVQVTGSHVDGLKVMLASGGDVQGTVRLVDATTPVDLKNLSVTLRPVSNSGFGFGSPQRARVSEDLKFTIKGIAPMKFTVSVNGMPNNCCYVKSVTFGGRVVPPEGLDMSGGGGLEVTISAAPGEIDAVVMDKDGKSVPGAVVAIVPKDGSNPMVMMTDDNGILAARGLKPGDYKILAWEDVESGAPQDPDFLQQFEKEMKSVKLDASGHEAVQLKAIAAQ